MPEEDDRSRRGRWKCTLVAFWLLGLCNNFGYVVMLSAAHDMLAGFDHRKESVDNSFVRQCNSLSTGVILLADIIPSIFVKVIAPFLPLKVKLRMAGVVLLSGLGFLLVGLHAADWLVVLGVVSTSFSCGLGETTLLGYMVFFKSYNVISTWSSGTGAAGLLGAGTYLLFTSAFKLTSATTMFIMLAVPLLQAASFFTFIDHPDIERLSRVTQDFIPNQPDTLTIQEKFKLLPRLCLRYTTPFGLVYLFEYFINQGLYELMYIPNTFLSHSEQYRTYQFLYQAGVFISRSSMNLVKIDFLWIMAGLQFLNVLICLSELYFGFLNYLFVLFPLILWEGLLGGASYVNTYRRIAQEHPANQKQFCMAINGVGDAAMITLAGLLAAPIHNKLCMLQNNY